MANVFVIHVEEDCDLVLRMVDHVEGMEQHRIWSFNRDPGHSEIASKEIFKAIQACDVLVVMLSPSALNSVQVAKEVKLAQEHNKDMLFILLGVTAEGIQAARPDWASLPGAQANLALGTLGESGLFDDIVKTLNSYAPSPGQAAARWAADATMMQLHNLPRVLFQTPSVQEFLEGVHFFFVSATKGVGKTLLLKSKRAQLMEEHTQKVGGRSDVLFLPQDRPYLDNMSGEWPTLSSEKIEFLADLRSSRRLWAMALKLSILSHFPDLYAQLKTDDLPVPIRHSLQHCVGIRTTSTIVFRNLLTTQTVKSIHALLDRLDTSAESIFRSIHSGVHCFIDTVEQGVSNMDRSAWTHLQAGLIEAAWDVMTSNNHIKIYASIREEAFASYTSSSKINLCSSVLTLRYSRDELHQMMDRLSCLYEREPSFYQFAGRRRIRNRHDTIEEDTFSYVHRHTIGRPRDMVVICSEVARNRSLNSDDHFRNIVMQSASNLLAPLVFSEMNVFLDCLRDKPERIRFFRLLSHNVLSRQEVEIVCAEFNGLDDLNFHQLDANGVTIAHPFCELWNCGLIGTVRQDRSDIAVLQHFRQPYDLMTRCESSLPNADYYLIHPALSEFVSQHTQRGSHHLVKYIAVGHGCRWANHFSSIVALQKGMSAIQDTGLRQRINEYVESQLHLDGSTVDKPSPLPELEVQGFDDVYLLLLEFLDLIRQGHEKPTS